MVTMIATPATGISAEALALLGDAFEVVHGTLIEREPMASLSVRVRDNLHFVLEARARQSREGLVFGDGQIFLMSKDSTGITGAYIPDISFVRLQNVPSYWDYTMHFPGAPDLAIEVVSANDNADKLQTKIRGYLTRGTEQVWVIYPESREMLVYDRAQPDVAYILRDQAVLDASHFLSGLNIPLVEIFRVPSLQ